MRRRKSIPLATISLLSTLGVREFPVLRIPGYEPLRRPSRSCLLTTSPHRNPKHWCSLDLSCSWGGNLSTFL